MAKSTPVVSVDVLPPESEGVIASWDGLYHAFGARAEGFDVTEDGIVIRGLSVAPQYDVAQLILDVNHKSRRVQLFPTILWINGQAPAPFTTAQEMTAFMVANFKGSVEKDSTRAPKYVRDAFTALKASQGIASKRGPKTRTINLKNLSTLDASTFKNANVSRADLEALIAVAQAAVEDAPAPAEAVTAES